MFGKTPISLHLVVAGLLLASTIGMAAPPGVDAAPAPRAAEIKLVEVRQALLDDPNLMAKVAARQGMTGARFMGQEEGRILEMVRAYLAERQARAKREPK